MHLWGIPSAGAGFYGVRGGIAPGSERSEYFLMGIWETAITKVVMCNSRSMFFEAKTVAGKIFLSAAIIV